MGQFFSIKVLRTKKEKEHCPMAIVTLHFPIVKATSESRPSKCHYCNCPILQR